jgi:hypothetical protein
VDESVGRGSLIKNVGRGRLKRCAFDASSALEASNIEGLGRWSLRNIRVRDVWIGHSGIEFSAIVG